MNALSCARCWTELTNLKGVGRLHHFAMGSYRPILLKKSVIQNCLVIDQ
jgi:hypothetical protein